MSSPLTGLLGQGRPGTSGPALRRALTDAADTWLRGLFDAAAPPPGVALVAVGSLGRAELTAASDLDVVLVHRGTPTAALGGLADRVFYPVWDAGVALDHSVRTVPEALGVAAADLKAALGLLDARPVAGDATLGQELRTAHLRAWAAGAGRRVPELAAAVGARTATAGQLAFLLEPDLKESRGGLRDLTALRALAAAQVSQRPDAAVLAAGELLLDVRGALAELSGGAGRRRSERLALQDQDPVAAALGYPDADALMLALAGAGRLLAHRLDRELARLRPAPGAGGSRLSAALGRVRAAGRRPGPGGPTDAGRTPLADGVVAAGGQVQLAQHADLSDPVLPLRAAAAAARSGLPWGPGVLARLAEHSAPLPTPWPAAAREQLVALLGAGPAAVPVCEDLDFAGLWGRWLPEWDPVRSRPQRNAYHRYTVDRHLWETAAAAAALTRQVSRPDLLLLGALLHDIGKGRPGDHTEVGITLVDGIARRWGLSADDTALLVGMVRHHLLLPDTAQRRDPDDPAVVAAVATAVGSRELLELLAALTAADSQATGPAAWSPWKERLLGTLVARVSAQLAGIPVAPSPLSDAQQELLDARVVAVDVRPGADPSELDSVDVVVPDRPGLLAAVAGVLALHRLEIRSLVSHSAAGWSLLTVRAHPRFGSGPDPAVLASDLRRWVAPTGDGAVRDVAELTAIVAARAAAYPPPRGAAPPAVRFPDVVDSRGTVVEVRAPDGLGVLHRIATTLTAAGLDVVAARCQTLGVDVVDAFTVTPPPADRDALAAAVSAALLPAAPEPGAAGGPERAVSAAPAGPDPGAALPRVAATDPEPTAALAPTAAPEPAVDPAPVG